jgi:hypothetical protein
MPPNGSVYGPFFIRCTTKQQRRKFVFATNCDNGDLHKE